jgi:hypothetical protein
MYILIPIVSAILLVQSARISNYIIRSIVGYTLSAGMFIGVMLAFAQIVSAQWIPIKGYQPEQAEGNFSYYSMDKQNAIDMCKEVLRINNVNLSTIDVDRNHDPIINNHLQKPEQPDMMYMVYVAKTTTGYVVRLVFRADEYFEIEEDFMTIVYESVD